MMFFKKYKSAIDESKIDTAKKLYNRSSKKVELLYELIRGTNIIEKYNFDKDYFTVMAYMYVCNFYKMKMKNRYGLKNMKDILVICFQMVSDSLTDPKYKKTGEEHVNIFLHNILPDFEDNSNRATHDGKDPFLYMGARFLLLIFKIPINELETEYYYGISEKIKDLFYSIFDDDDYNLL